MAYYFCIKINQVVAIGVLAFLFLLSNISGLFFTIVRINECSLQVIFYLTSKDSIDGKIFLEINTVVKQ